MQGLLKVGLACLIWVSAIIGWAEDTELEYYRDTSASLTLDELLSNETLWQTTQRNKANFGFTSDAV